MLDLALFKKLQFFSIFRKTTMAPPNSILGIIVNFNNDQDPRKINLGVGAYRNNNLEPVVLKAVRKVQRELLEDKSLNKVLVY